MFYYAVAKGWNIGIFRTLADVKKNTEGYWGKQYRRFRTEPEAKAYLRERGASDDSLDFINIYTTGSSVGSPGPGGYGYVIIINGEEHEQSFGGFALTTNIRMELMAPIIALEGLRGIPNPIIVHSGYSYLANAINKGWLEKWKKRRWNNTQGFKIQDVDLWRRLFIAMKGLDVTFRWAAAHSRMPLSKLADTLANEAAHQPDLPADKGYQNKV